MATRSTRTPAKDRPSYRCSECGWTTVKWLGRCPECQAWGTVEEFGAAPAVRTTAAGRVTTAALPIGQVDGRQATARGTGVDELDRVLGGGLVPGAVVLLAGEPGVGKSTLLLDVAAKAASDAHRTLYITGEESASQVRLRADRIGALSEHLFLAAETDLSAVLGHLDTVKPSLLVLDSVQTVASPEIDGAPGGMAQVREVAGALIRASKERGMATVLVGHVTKDGGIAGPRLLEHLVDVVLSFEGDRHARLRLVRGIKNRYGATDEVGCFELHDEGITGLADPSGLFLTRRAEPVPGTCLTVTLEGRRPLVAEVQALTVDTQIPSPRRTTSGLETSRVSMMLAVLEQRGRISALGKRDIYSATVGGVRLTEPAADLAIALALASAASDTPLPKNLVAVGEVGLAGEVRRVTGVQRRLSEAARLGFTHALVPGDAGKIPPGMRVLEVADIGEALRVLPKRPRREAPQAPRESPERR
ncbi:DNA repair protein RadA [Streptomyces buecherae]|uniref:DNA repair protein RadA n=1 Tax=Streptomyces buecherae TaxID=2763006 RepID=UPI003402E338